MMPCSIDICPTIPLDKLRTLLEGFATGIDNKSQSATRGMRQNEVL